MVDDKPEDASRSSGPGAEEAGATRRTRTPPTIDLEASRVETSDAETSDSEAAARARKPRPDGQRSARSRRGNAALPFGLAVSAAAGAIAAVLIGGAAWFAGLLDNSRALDVPTVAMLETLGARLARLEEAPKEASKSSAAKPDATLAARLGALEKSNEQSLTAMRDEQNAVRAKADRTASAVDEIKSASQGVAVAPNLSAIEARIARIETKMQALASENEQLKAAQLKAASADDVRLKRVVAATSLDLAVRQGEPFASALAAARRFTDDAAALKPLDEFAANGVPGVAALSSDLLTLLPQLGTAPDAVRDGAGWFDRLRASAARLIKIQRADTTAGSDNASIVARVTAAARRNDVAEARRELNVLPRADRAKVQSWIDKIDARDAALAASRQFAANAMTALARSAP